MLFEFHSTGKIVLGNLFLVIFIDIWAYVSRQRWLAQVKGLVMTMPVVFLKGFLPATVFVVVLLGQPSFRFCIPGKDKGLRL